ncbi:ubiquinol-cytochrome c reductase core subunit 1 [Coemansia spiralis]|uniref:Cytochrome b-c1 complex subunit 2, mitochondrial n=2 Tax=Coemansia TaxID=4863 RepID=A0A9W8KY86_9FUNG|nr:Metalloenzyme, LuxS/M16 peptidase-like protein [Coemansia spiralis]KAJ1989991.1 ubiquinol-cytochrome c reductase core subunit 1 [Coemansia umbellata]KAJ2621506.1 ubiquinol-cytochrome c reductase core subunit 1 [Coemansia sp. RSA 1358]KAJ2677182.1 ubiquinol-cytochrome c reductase core subunit 1 [Coemansia spiralis]
MICRARMFKAKSLAKLAPLTRAYASLAPVATTANGIKIAALDTESPLASLSLVINAGSRFETADTAGSAHYLKAFGFRNTQTRTGFRTVREAELNGATLTAEATRENITYTIRCFKDAVPYFVDVLADIATATKFTEHEFREINKLVEFESLRARSDPVTRVIEGVHQAAFRSGLGNSLFALPSAVATGDAVRQYAQNALSGRIAIVGTGVSAQALSELVGQSQFSVLSSQPLPTPQAKFTGGTQQIYEAASPLSYYALAFAAEPQAASVLAHLLGAQKRMKWSTGASPLAKLAATEGFNVEAFSYAYSDAGLVGVLVSAPTGQIKDAVEKVAKSIQSHVAKPGNEAAERAVAAAKVDIAGELATLRGTQTMLTQAALGQKNVVTLESVDQAAEKLSEAASKTFQSKPVAASVGLSQTTPYVDTLGF